MIPILFLDSGSFRQLKLLCEVPHDLNILFAIVHILLVIDRLPSLIDLNRLAAHEGHTLLGKAALKEVDELLLVLLDAPLHGAVPVIFDSVVCPTLQNVGDIRPFVGLVAVQEEQDPLFFAGPDGVPLNHWV